MRDERKAATQGYDARCVIAYWHGQRQDLDDLDPHGVVTRYFLIRAACDDHIAATDVRQITVSELHHVEIPMRNTCGVEPLRSHRTQDARVLVVVSCSPSEGRIHDQPARGAGLETMTSAPNFV